MTDVLPGPLFSGADLADLPQLWPAVTRQEMTGRITTYRRDEVTTPIGETVTREWLSHPGAVGVIALDENGRIAVVNQYRHPAGHVLIEPPAGLLDVAGEPPLLAAQRELAEEARLQAGDWRVLVDWFTSPGSSQEMIRLYLAQGLRPAPLPDGFVAEGEEATMTSGWIDLAEAVRAVYAGQLMSPSLVIGLLALEAARLGPGLASLRPADADWPAYRARLSRP